MLPGLFVGAGPCLRPPIGALPSRRQFFLGGAGCRACDSALRPPLGGVLRPAVAVDIKITHHRVTEGDEVTRIGSREFIRGIRLFGGASIPACDSFWVLRPAVGVDISPLTLPL